MQWRNNADATNGIAGELVRDGKLVCAVAIQCLDVFEEREIQQIADRLRARLKDLGLYKGG